MGQEHSRPGAKWDRDTTGWGHNGTGTQQEGGQWDRDTTAQWDRDTTRLGHNGMERDGDGDTMGLGHTVRTPGHEVHVLKRPATLNKSTQKFASDA